jgi:hypothetical protein
MVGESLLFHVLRFDRWRIVVECAEEDFRALTGGKSPLGGREPGYFLASIQDALVSPG